MSEESWMRRERTGLLLSVPTSSFQMKVELAFHLEIKVLESGGSMWRHLRCLKSSVKFPQSVGIWGAMSFAGDGGGCSTVFHQVQGQHSRQLRDFRALYASIC